MPRDEDDDLYDEEFDFVDDDDEEEEAASAEESDLADETDEVSNEQPEDEAETAQGEDEEVDEYGRPEPAANYVVHVYEHKKFKRTIERPFTPEDAEAFASEYNRTSKPYGRFAVTGKNDAKPKKALD
jgi:hypothetical protein